ncbi:MAG: succinate dehydrogenase cytochrome b subunit [Melioribacteraceae bacterium]|nr:succinate dehydrogenase cytochrome b subunit [Melioribacteraceae bacterium]
MGWLGRTINSSIGKKFIMAFTGISLILFLLFHLAGNLTLYAGKDAFNAYVATLDTVKPIVRIVEVGLALVFLFHIFNGIKLWIENRKARPVNYAVNGSSKNSTFYSRTMIHSGSIILIFLILHLTTFWATFNFTGHPVDGSHEYFDIIIYFFQKWWYALIYFIAMILLGFHLNHGFQSAFQTFGWNHNKYFPMIQKIGSIYAIVVAVGFGSLPVYFYLSSVLGGN